MVKLEKLCGFLPSKNYCNIYNEPFRIISGSINVFFNLAHENEKFTIIAKDVINLEIKALQQLKNSITNSFNDAVDQLSKCQSKVILCGVGKSGIIANKISSKL